ncbi:MAG TPA: DNA-processing protein DprA [Galbitalea sp.]|jgi:DNA processing protein
MTMFGLKEAEVATLVRAVAGEQLEREAIRERFARASWTGIAEPGDSIAGLVIAALGAVDSLEGLVEQWSARAWLEALRLVGVVDVAESVVEEALARWKLRVKSEPTLLALRQAARYGARLLTPGTAGWPAGVDDLGPHAPIALWVRGTQVALAALDNSIALVGARAATGYGEHVAMEFSAGLVDRGFAIVSGAAYGVDGMAHRAAMASHGITVAFLAGGVDHYYPSGHDALLTRMVEVGAIISELPPGQPPTKWRFLQRNRLIAAASQATVVIEAGWRSGSLNTAGHAANLGRPVGAVPGPITSAASAGCHRLVRDYDATLVTSVEDVVELVEPRRLEQPPVPEALEGRVEQPRAAGTGVVETSRTTYLRPLSPEQTRLLDAMSYTAPRQTQDIAARAGLSVAAVQSLLGELELETLVSERERGWIKVKPDDQNKPPEKLA